MIVTELGSLDYPQSMVIDDNGVIYFNHTETGLWKFDTKNPNKEPIHLYFGDADFRGIVWDGNNTLYICAYGSGYYMVEYHIDTGEVKRSEKDSDSDPPTIHSLQGIALDKNRYLYVTDDSSRHIFKINPENGQVESVAGAFESTWDEEYQCLDTIFLKGYQDGNATKATFRHPAGIAVLDDGTIYVADFNTIRQIKDGVVSTIAGSPHKTGFRDGTLAEARFRCFLGYEMCLDVDGSLLVRDSVRIRKIDVMNNRVTTVLRLEASGSMRCFTVDKTGAIYVAAVFYFGTKTGNYQSTQVLLKIERRWKWERFLWIGYYKETSSYCNLPKLPKEIVKEIASYLDSNSHYLAPKGRKRKPDEVEEEDYDDSTKTFIVQEF